MKFIRNVSYLLGKRKRILANVIILIFVLEFIRLVSNTVYGSLIDVLVDDFKISTFYLVSWLLASVLTWFFVAVKDFIIIKLLVGVEYDVPLRSMQHLLRLSMGYFEVTGTGRLAKKIEKGTDGLSSLLQSFSWDLLSSGIQYVITTLYLFYLYPVWGIVLIVIAPLFTLVTMLLNRIKNPMREKRHELYEEAGHILYQVIENMPLVKAHAQESSEIERYSEKQEEIRQVTEREFRVEYIFNFFRGLLVTAAICSVFWFGALGVIAGEIKVGLVVTAMGLSIAATLSLYRLTHILVRFMDNYTAITRLIKFLNEVPDVQDDIQAVDAKGITGDVVFEGVTFNYALLEAEDEEFEAKKAKVERELEADPERFRGVKGINLEVKAGETVAFVGESGSGKSTLMSLLLRFYDPHEGRILVGGVPINKMTQASFRSLVAVVLQETSLFDRSIRENVSGNACNGECEPDPTEEEVLWDVLARAHAKDFVTGLKDQLDTVIGWRGVRLSGGQRQRIAIAIALNRDPLILILDEATSALDTKSEREIQAAMRQIHETGSTTTFIIAHRLSTITHADKIVVMDNGRIAQIGTHEELLQDKGGKYAEMVAAQTV